MNANRPTRRTRTAVLLCTLLTGATIGSQAHAQTWLPDRAYTEGPGIRTGDVLIHPGIAVRGGYDTNVFKADGETRTVVENGQTIDRTQKIVGAATLAVTPHIHIATLNPQRLKEGEDRTSAEHLPALAFRGGLSATYYHIFADDAPRNVEFDTDLNLTILPRRPFNIDVGLTYLRNIRPFTQYAGLRNAYIFDTIQPRVRLNFGSRSQVLTGYAGYAPRVSIFESRVFDYLNSFTHVVEAGSAWRFLPSTALVYDATLDLQDYKEDNAAATISPVLFADTKRFRTRLGINGALTRTLTLRVLAGYTAIFLSDKFSGERLDDHEDVIGEAVLGFRFGPAQSGQFELGYQRDVQASALGGWTRFDRGFATVRAMLGRVFQLSVEGGASYVTYGSLWGFDQNDGAVALGSGNKLDRNDVRVDGAVRGEYRVTDWLSFMADVSVQALVTDFEYAVYSTQTTPVPDPASYFAVLAFGGVRAHY